MESIYQERGVFMVGYGSSYMAFYWYDDATKQSGVCIRFSLPGASTNRIEIGRITGGAVQFAKYVDYN